MLLAEWHENWRGTQHIAGRAQLDNEDVFRDGIVIRATVAMDALALVRRAGNVPSEVTAIGMVNQF